MRTLRARLAGAWSRFLASPDREHEMALNRLAPAIIAVTVNGLAPADALDAPAPLFFALLYLAGVLALCVHLIRRPDQKLSRRQIALAMDLSACSFEMHAGGESAAWLYPAYLWVVFGNGFRFGPRQLLVAMVAAICGFTVVIQTTPFWWSKPSICVGLLIGLLVIPLYTFSLLDKLSRARRQAVEANQAKTLFLAKVSHELRTPLNAIIGCGALMADERLDAEQRDMVHTIVSSGRSLLSLIDGILDLSRLEAGRMPVSTADFDLCDLLEELRRSVLAQARAKQLAVAVHIGPGTRTDLHGDVALLREILLNLLSNAVKFTDSGTVVLAAQAVPGEHDPGAGGQVRLRLEVDDTGIGIAPEAQARIFDMFTQADETIANRYGGTGLGLSITRQLVELLGGVIDVSSEPGQGATFRVELDLRTSREAAPEARGAPTGRCFLVAGPAEAAEPVARRLAALGVAVETLPAADRAAAQSLADGGAADVALFAAVRNACETPGLSFSALLANDALRFFEVTPGAVRRPASRARRRDVATTIAAESDAAEILRALDICSAIAVARTDGAPGVLRRAAADALVLVADDNRVNQKVMSRILERGGYRVAIASDGEEMLDMLAAAPADLVVVDVNMPNMNGIEATQIFRMMSLGGPYVPIVGVTADATPQTREQCIEAGMDMCLLKPVEPVDLLQALDGLLAAQPRQPRTVPDPLRTSAGQTVADGARGAAGHPRLRPAASPVIDRETLDGLRALGGDAFVREITGDFFAEAHEVLESLREAAAAAEAEPFRAGVHAIRSGASNFGARQLCELAERWETVSAEELRQSGGAYIADLEQHLLRLERALAPA